MPWCTGCENDKGCSFAGVTFLNTWISSQDIWESHFSSLLKNHSSLFKRPLQNFKPNVYKNRAKQPFSPLVIVYSSTWVIYKCAFPNFNKTVTCNNVIQMPGASLERNVRLPLREHLAWLEQRLHLIRQFKNCKSLYTWGQSCKTMAHSVF